MKDLDYTIYFVPYRPIPSEPDNVVWEFMYSLGTRTIKQRSDDSETLVDTPELFAKIIDANGDLHAFHLLKMKHPVVSEPVRKRDIVEIIGRDGDIDLYEALFDKPIFERRTIEEQFMLLGQNAESGNYYVGSDRAWAAQISALKNYFNSFTKQMRIVLSHDPGFYWEGRVTAAVDELAGQKAVVKITADVEPYKYERYHSCEPWIWDDFSFIDGIIRDYSNIPIVHTESDSEYGYMVFEIPMRLRDVVPKFQASGSGVQVSVNGSDWVTVPTEDFSAVDGIQLSGTRNPYNSSDALYIRKTVSAARTISIMMRGATL